MRNREPKGEIENASITSTKLGFDRGVFLSSWLHLKYVGGGQGFGGFALGNSSKNEDSGAYAERWVMRILEVLDVNKWEDLPGTICRVDHDWGTVYGIGHYLKDEWFYPSEEFGEMKNKEQTDE